MRVKKKEGERMVPGMKYEYFRLNLQVWRELKMGDEAIINLDAWAKMEGVKDAKADFLQKNPALVLVKEKKADKGV